MYSTPLLTALLALLPATLAVHPHERLRAPKLRIPVASAIPTSTASVRTPSPTSTSATRISNPTSPFFVPTFRNANASALRVPYPLPLVGFPLQASWAGRLPINDTDTERRELFFWYWPASQRTASDTLTIWLNGGPGCSSLDGFLTETGPVKWAPGTSGPVSNPYAWSTVSDMIYIEQPVGTGFTLGTPNVENETQLAEQFYGFLTHLYSVFPELATKKLFIAGESYAGFYIPYIATRILNASAAEKKALPLDLQGVIINDGVYSSFTTSEQIPIAQFIAANQQTLGVNASQVATWQNLSVACGYQAVLDQVTYPPAGKIWLPNGNTDGWTDACDIYDDWWYPEFDINPCFNEYRITDRCPTPVDHAAEYFSRADVQAALHVPGFGNWSVCTDNNVFVNGTDDSAYSETLLPALLAALPRGVTLWHGLADSLLLNVGDRITIQNLTWGGAQGFSAPPSTPLVLNGTHHGVYHTERKLTYIEVQGAGHMIPMDVPALALHVFTAFIGKSIL